MVFSFLASKYSTAFSVLLQRSASVSVQMLHLHKKQNKTNN